MTKILYLVTLILLPSLLPSLFSHTCGGIEMTKILELIIFPGCPILFVVLIVGEIVRNNFKLMRINTVGYNPPPIGAKSPLPPTHSPSPVVLSVKEVEEQAKKELQSVFTFAPKVLVKEKKYFRRIRPEVL